MNGKFARTGGRFVRSSVVCALGLTLALAGCGGDDSPSDEPAEESQPELPDGAVAFVDEVEDGEVTQADLDAGISLTAGLGGTEIPAEDDPAYDSLVATALQDLLLARWVRGEAEERGVSVTEADIDAELENVINGSFGGREDYEKFLEDSDLSEDDARKRVELQALTTALQEDVIAEAANPEEVETVTAEFQEDFLAKWRERTVCSEELPIEDDELAQEALAERCSNYDAPESPADEPSTEP